MLKKKVLIIEDNEIDRELFALAFEKIQVDVSIDFDVTFLKTFEEAKTFMKSNDVTFDFAIFDLLIDDNYSLDLIADLRKHQPEISILILSSSAYEEDIQKSYDLGASDFTMKPLSFSALCDLLKKVSATYCQ